MRKCAVTITIVHGRVVVNTPVALPDGTYKAVLVLNDAADQSLVVQDTPPGVHAQRTREPRDSAVLERRIQSVGKTNFVLLCAALLRGVRDDQTLMRLVPDTRHVEALHHQYGPSTRGGRLYRRRARHLPALQSAGNCPCGSTAALHDGAWWRELLERYGNDLLHICHAH